MVRLGTLRVGDTFVCDRYVGTVLTADSCAVKVRVAADGKEETAYWSRGTEVAPR